MATYQLLINCLLFTGVYCKAEYKHGAAKTVSNYPLIIFLWSFDYIIRSHTASISYFKNKHVLFLFQTSRQSISIPELSNIFPSPITDLKATRQPLQNVLNSFNKTQLCFYSKAGSRRVRFWTLMFLGLL